jgi:glucose/arabinose dehydrogenase
MTQYPVSLALVALLGASSAGGGRWGPAPCPADSGGLVVPQEFCAALLARDAGKVRQLAVAPNGDLYAAVQGRSLFGAGGVAAYRDRDGDGRVEEHVSFGPAGGNDVEVHQGYLYLSLSDRIIRWRLTPGKLEPDGGPETVVRDLPHGGDHGAKSLAFGAGNAMYLSVGSATNSCQEHNRVAGSRGLDPCRELERRAGIWLFAADRPGQRFGDGRRFATGMRNPEALAIQPGSGAFYAAIMGRDQLSDNWGYSDAVNADDPAEELVRVRSGDDFGWPYCYYSNQARKKVLAPEYGGDGAKVGRCASAKGPVVAFPGHWAPLAMAFHAGDQLGPEYQGGLFVAFHGSWNRSPLPQAGFRVAYVPFKEGEPAGGYETFATGSGGPTDLRASGVAVGPDGSLYISADSNGKIWKVWRRR